MMMIVKGMCEIFIDAYFSHHSFDVLFQSVYVKLSTISKADIKRVSEAETTADNIIQNSGMYSRRIGECVGVLPST